MQTVIALAGIGGTLVAGLGGTYLGARMERHAEGRREGAAVRRAARLIDADLMFAETLVRTSIEKKRWWLIDRRLTSEGWQQHRDVIAAKLPWNDWVAVMVAVVAVGDLHDSRDRCRKIQLAEMARDPEMSSVLSAADALGLDIADPSPSIPDATITQIEPMLKDVEAGRAALATLTQRNAKR